MADKRIDQLPVATQINDADLFVIEQSNTAKSVSGQKIKALVPTSLSQLSQDSMHRLVTDAEKTAWNGKENKGKITISGVEKTANTHTVTIVTNGTTTNLTLVGVS